MFNPRPHDPKSEQVCTRRPQRPASTRTVPLASDALVPGNNTETDDHEGLRWQLLEPGGTPRPGSSQIVPTLGTPGRARRGGHPDRFDPPGLTDARAAPGGGGTPSAEDGPRGLHHKQEPWPIRARWGGSRRGRPPQAPGILVGESPGGRRLGLRWGRMGGSPDSGDGSSCPDASRPRTRRTVPTLSGAGHNGNQPRWPLEPSPQVAGNRPRVAGVLVVARTSEIIAL